MILCAAPLTDSEPALVSPQPANTDAGPDRRLCQSANFMQEPSSKDIQGHFFGPGQVNVRL